MKQLQKKNVLKNCKNKMIYAECGLLKNVQRTLAEQPKKLIHKRRKRTSSCKEI